MEDKENLFKDWMAQFDATNPPEMRDAFNAGYEAAKPKWHDLRKDPNDLPELSHVRYSRQVVALIQGEPPFYHFTDMLIYDGTIDKWRIKHTDCIIDNVVAWMGLPEWKGGEE